jgi:NADH-quinone oxidoreductase subunit L
MVAAGVYMTARIHPLLTDGSLFFVAIIGGITAFLAATMALVQWDIKAVLAYSTISQLGYMMIGLGAGAYTAGVAHLFTHAIFKCMLFLCAGSVIHACHHLQDMNRMGGLRHKMPWTHNSMLIGTLAITGVPFFSAFYSKDAILAGSLARALHLGGLHWLPFVLGIVTAGLTAFYMFRLIFMTFYGEPRDKHIYDHAHESPAVATVPLMILATLCLGFWWSGHLIGGDIISVKPLASETAVFASGGKEIETESVTKGWLDKYFVSPAEVLPNTPQAAENPPEAEEVHEHHELHHKAHTIATVLSVIMVLLGLGVAYAMYIQRAVQPDNLLNIAPLALGYSLFSQLWFFDRLYQDGIVPAFKIFNRACWWFDANIVDSYFVDGWAVIVKNGAQKARWVDNWVVDKMVDLFGWVTMIFGQVSRALQVGKIQFYVCVTFGVAAVLLLGLMLAFP